MRYGGRRSCSTCPRILTCAGCAIHPDPLERTRARAYSRLTMRAALKRCAVVGASTPTVARQLASRYSLSTVSVIPLGVDLDLFRPSHTPTGGSIFHLGSSDPRDRTVLVVEAWALARQRRDDLPRLVVGGGLASVEDLVERRATELGVPVELTGRLSDEALAEQLRNAAAVVQPSSDEGFGLQPLEAMASGAPVVVTEAGAVLDVVGDAAVVRSATAAASRGWDCVRSCGGRRATRRSTTKSRNLRWDSSRLCRSCRARCGRGIKQLTRRHVLACSGLRPKTKTRSPCRRRHGEETRRTRNR